MSEGIAIKGRTCENCARNGDPKQEVLYCKYCTWYNEWKAREDNEDE